MQLSLNMLATLRRKKEKLRGGWVQSANFASECARKLLARIFNLMFDIPTFQRPSASLFIGARAR